MSDSALEYPLGDHLPASATTTLLPRGGIHWLRMPLPFALDHINLWYLPATRGGSQVDCGLGLPANLAIWRQLLSQQTLWQNTAAVVVTHFHPDHVGAAAFLCEQFQAPLKMSLSEYCWARMAHSRAEGYSTQSWNRFFQSHGMTDPDVLAAWAQREDYYPSLVLPPPNHFIRILDGDEITLGELKFKAIVGHGHSPEHMAFYCAAEKILISGDMVLPRISTNVSIIALEPEGDNLAGFLASLKRFGNLPADTLVLPSHGRPFIGLHQRIAQLEEHHRERLAILNAALHKEGELNAAQAIPHLFNRGRNFSPHDMSFAMGEALAHLHYLWYQGKVERHVTQHEGRNHYLFRCR